jgi:hypothetical protein
MDRGKRRTLTDKVARKRAKELSDAYANFNIFPQEDIEVGYFKKNNGFTIKKESTRLWNKLSKKKKEEIKNKKRNPEIFD